MPEKIEDFKTPKEFEINDHIYDALKAVHADYRKSSENYSNAHLARVISTLILRKNQWRVVGITAEALTELQKNDFEKPRGRVIQRGHLVPRANVASYIFGKEVFISKDELEHVLWFYDRTILMTSEENKKTHKTPDFYLFEFTKVEPIFLSAYIGFEYSEREKKFLEEFSKNLPKKSDIDTLYPDRSKFEQKIHAI